MDIRKNKYKQRSALRKKSKDPIYVKGIITTRAKPDWASTDVTFPFQGQYIYASPNDPDSIRWANIITGDNYNFIQDFTIIKVRRSFDEQLRKQNVENRRIQEENPSSNFGFTGRDKFGTFY